MAEGSNPLRPVTLNLSHRRNHAPVAMRRINISTATTVVNKVSCNAKSARRLFNPIIVLKELSNPNTFVPTANAPYSAGNPVATSSFTNAVMIIAITDSTLLTNSTQQKKRCKKQNLLNLNLTTFTANIYSKPMSLNIPRRLNHSSILQRSITPKMS